MNSARIKRLGLVTLVICVWPIYSTRNCIKYANDERGWRAKALFLLSCVPFLVISAMVWAAAWAALWWLVLRMFTG